MKTPLSVLIVEDDYDDFEFIRDAFKKSEHKVELHLIKNGEFLLEHLHDAISTGARLPDLVLLDLNMPRKNGYATLQELKEDAHLKDVPVIVVTSSIRPEDETLCKEVGCKAFFRKPLTIDDYDKLINDIMTTVS